MSVTNLVRLPHDLYLNLSRLATMRGTTMTNVIGSVVLEAIEEGELRPENTGLRLDLDLDTNRIRLASPEATLAILDARAALALADALDQLDDHAMTFMVAADNGALKVRRLGKGIAIETRGPDAERIRATGAQVTGHILARRLRRLAGTLSTVV